MTDSNPDTHVRSNRIAFESFCNKYEGQTCVVVGKGPTNYDVTKLAELTGPVFFINDAVGWQKYLPPDRERFMFAHDATQLPWFSEDQKATVCIPLDGNVLSSQNRHILDTLPHYVGYKWNPRPGDISLLDLSREELAACKPL